MFKTIWLSKLDIKLFKTDSNDVIYRSDIVDKTVKNLFTSKKLKNTKSKT